MKALARAWVYRVSEAKLQRYLSGRFRWTRGDRRIKYPRRDVGKSAQAVGAQDVYEVAAGRTLAVGEASRALIVQPAQGPGTPVLLDVVHPIDEHDPIEHVLDNPVLVE